MIRDFVRSGEWWYLIIIGLMVYWIYLTNQPKYYICDVGNAKWQKCVIYNILGKEEVNLVNKTYGTKDSRTNK